MLRPITLPLLFGLLLGQAAAMDRYLDVHDRIISGPKMEMSAATFLGAGGCEELLGVTALPDGRILVVGNSWGPPFLTGTVRVLGQDRLWDLPAIGLAERSGSATDLLPDDHPNRTGFFAILSANLDRVESITRLGWGSASITAVRLLKDGTLILTGRARRDLMAMPCPAAGRHVLKSAKGRSADPAWPGCGNDSYIARLALDGQGFTWIWLLEDFPDPPRRIYAGAQGQVVFRLDTLRRISADGATCQDYGDTPVAKVAHYLRGISDLDGSIFVGGSFMTSTGREPWKMPWLDVYGADGSHRASYYTWQGRLVGHDDFRLVSDSSVGLVNQLPNGKVLLTGWSDGGNTVFQRHPADLEYTAPSAGLPMSIWGAGVLSASNLVVFDPHDPRSVAYTVWLSFLPNGPNSIYIDAIGGLDDGSVVLTGRSASYLVQTTQQHYRATGHYALTERDKARGIKAVPRRDRKGWPIWQGLGGGGYYVTVLSPGLDKMYFSSALPNCEAITTAPVPGGLIGVTRCTGEDAGDGRTPALMPYDLADPAGMIRRLHGATTGPVARIWQRLDQPLRQRLSAWVGTGSEVLPEDLLQALFDGLDELLFGCRDLYDARLWPQAHLDADQAAIAAGLPAAACSADQLGGINRRLLEQALPEHIYPLPPSNRLRAIRGVQSRFGGGTRDGYIFRLQSLREVETPPPAQRQKPATIREVPNPALATTAKKPAKPLRLNETSDINLSGTLEPCFDRSSLGTAKLPGYCTTYAICRNPSRVRPLYLHGAADQGDLKVSFTTDILESAGFALKSQGGFRLGLVFDAKPAADIGTIAAGAWLTSTAKTPISLRLTGLNDWKPQDDLSAKVFDPKRGVVRRADGTIEPITAWYGIRIDQVELAIDGKTLALKNIPARAGIVVRDWLWSIRFEMDLDLPPGSLGMTDTTPVRMRVVHEAFSPAPTSQRAPAKPGTLEE